MKLPISITDDRIAALIHNDPLAYRWYTLASRNGLTEQQFLTELLLSKYSLPDFLLHPEQMNYSDAKRQAEEFVARYGLKEFV